MEIKRAGSQSSGKGPSDWFSGAVRIDPLFQATAPARAAGAAVTFEPGARTAWRTHGLAHTSAWTDPDRHRRMRLGTAGWRTNRRNSTGRRRLVSAGGEALAWCLTHDCHDPYRNSGRSGGQSRGVDGEGQRRSI
jgi:hypothetical protein